MRLDRLAVCRRSVAAGSLLVNKMRTSTASVILCGIITSLTFCYGRVEEGYDALVEQVQAWHLANANVCGQDTTTCTLQRLIERFEACDNFRILNGCDVARHGTISWQAAVIIGGGEEATRRAPVICSGTLISARHVAVDGKCLQPTSSTIVSLSAIKVIVGGAVSISPLVNVDPTYAYDAQTFAVHPSYSTAAGGSKYDVAIIKLSRDVPVSLSGVRPVCLSTSSSPGNITTAPRRRTNCIVGGYGVEQITPQGGVISLAARGTLRYTIVHALDNNVCSLFYKNEFDERITVRCEQPKRQN